MDSGSSEQAGGFEPQAIQPTQRQQQHAEHVGGVLCMARNGEHAGGLKPKAMKPTQRQQQHTKPAQQVLSEPQSAGNAAAAGNPPTHCTQGAGSAAHVNLQLYTPAIRCLSPGPTECG